MYRIIVIALIALSCISCENDEMRGQKIGYASKDFQVERSLSTSTETVDFIADQSVLFSTTFNEEVQYTLTIVGLSSGATKQITGLSKELLVNWKGNATLTFFKEEQVTVSLSVLGVEGVLDTKTLQIKKTYQPEGVQIANFELGGTKAGCWFPGKNSIDCNVTFTPEVLLEGKYAHLVKGISVDKPGDQFVGLASIDPRSGINKTGRYFTAPTTNSDSLYFNIFIYGTGDDNVAMFIKFMQDDDGNGSHESDRENGFEMQLKNLSHVGWKLFSFPYSSVPLGGNTGFGGNGDGIHRPDKIQKIELGLWALKNTNEPVQFIYDYAVFTANKPFGE